MQATVSTPSGKTPAKRNSSSGFSSESSAPPPAAVAIGTAIAAANVAHIQNFFSIKPSLHERPRGGNKPCGNICKEYLAGIFPALGKCARVALETLFGGIVTGKSTLVTDLARPLRRDSSAAEAKRANERVSAWLGRWDFVSGLNPWLLGKAAEEASDEATFALDFSDISKEFGGEGMEGMAPGWDGSRGVVAMGHDFVCVPLVGGGRREARTVYARLAKGCKSKGALHEEAQSAVMGATGGLGWSAEDRGMDSAEHIAEVKREAWKAVIRVNDMDRDVFGDGLDIGQSLAQVPFVPATLR